MGGGGDIFSSFMLMFLSPLKSTISWNTSNMLRGLVPRVATMLVLSRRLNASTNTAPCALGSGPRTISQSSL